MIIKNLDIVRNVVVSLITVIKLTQQILGLQLLIQIEILRKLEKSGINFGDNNQ